MKYGAKNQLAGTVTKIKRGTVMSQVNLEIKAAFNNSVEHVFHFHTLNFTPHHIKTIRPSPSSQA